MLEWINDHIESIVAGVVAFFAGVFGTGKLFLGLKTDMGEVKKDHALLRSEFDQMKLDQAQAKEQRDQIEKNTRWIMDNLPRRSSE